MVPTVPQTGDVIGGRFRVARMIARGGMSVVLAGTHLRHGTPVAIKLLQVTGSPASRAAARMEREARLLASVRNAHLTRVFGVGVTDQGTPYLVMELLTGGDLAALLDTEGPLPVDEAVALIIQACRGVGEAHARGIVHRDLKPANLFLTTGPGGAPCLKVLDFGVSKASEGSGAPSAGSREHIVGTPLYMAPEQFSTPAEVDARADVWALGVCLYELLTGHVPFREKTILRQYALLITRTPTPPSTHREEVPDAVEEVILRCLQRDPQHRYPDARALGAALERAMPSAAALASGVPHRETLDRVSRLSTLRAVVATVTEVADGLETRRFEPEMGFSRRRVGRLLQGLTAAAVLTIGYGLWDTFHKDGPADPIVLYTTAAPSTSAGAPGAGLVGAAHAEPAHAGPSHAGPSHAQPLALAVATRGELRGGSGSSPRSSGADGATNGTAPAPPPTGVAAALAEPPPIARKAPTVAPAPTHRPRPPARPTRSVRRPH